MNILGISAFYHDSAACLIRDGVIISAAQEERFSRKKHDSGFPGQAINYCLNVGEINIHDLDYVAFYDKPFQKFDRLLNTYLHHAPLGLLSFLQSMPLWLRQKLWIKDEIARTLSFSGPILFPEHHQSHAASAFFPSPFEQAAFLTVDGVGEWATSSYGYGQQNRIHVLGEMHFPHSLGLLYSAFTYFCGFRVNSGEYKLMGLAPYGEPRYVNTILSELIDLKADGSFRMNMRYFNYSAGLTMTNHRFAALFGGPQRQAESDITQREMDLARSIQEVTETIMLAMVKHVYLETGQDNLVLAGGVALNCVANGRLLREGPFKDIWIQPAAGDAGGALGAALFTHHQYLDQARPIIQSKDFMQGTYLGPEYTDETIRQYLIANNIPHTPLDPQDVSRKAAELILDQQVLGWFQGRMEFGPRALGNRSILGDARSSKMQSLMNLKIKYRESFRPFAPAALASKVQEVFQLDRPSPYMLLVAPIQERHRLEDPQEFIGLERLKSARSALPAITHVDQSARIQTVDREDNPRYHDILEYIDAKTGYPVIINTSFNVRGEPIVCTPEEAFLCFMRTEMDYLMLGNCLLSKADQKPVENDVDWKSLYELD